MVWQSLQRGSWGQRKQSKPSAACLPAGDATCGLREESTAQHQEPEDETHASHAEVLRLREQLRLAEARLNGSGTNHADFQTIVSIDSAGVAAEIAQHGGSLPRDDLSISAAVAVPRTHARSDGLTSSQYNAMHASNTLHSVQEEFTYAGGQSPLTTRTGAQADEPKTQRQLTEGQRVYHHRCDNAAMPTALRARPNSGAPPLQDVRAEPGAELSVLHCQDEVSNGESVTWVRVACATGEGWLKQMHLRELDNLHRMMHQRGDNPLLPTALRERPTNTARPLDNVKAEAREHVRVHTRKEVMEGGRRTTWAQVSCALGQGWIKIEHLREIASAAKQEDVFSMTAASTSNPESGPLPLQSSRSTLMQSQNSVTGKQSDACSEYPACGIRVRLGVLEFASGTVISNTSIFERVGIIALVQMGGGLTEGGPPAVWIDGAPMTELFPVKYGRVVSEDGRYATRMLCAFNSAVVEMPWPPQPSTNLQQQELKREPKKLQQLPDKVAVDIWLERTTVVDRMDRALGSLGFHHPAELDRRWLGRAVAELPPEGVDDAPFAWSVDGGRKEADCPQPNTLQIGVEWLFEDMGKDP